MTQKNIKELVEEAVDCIVGQFPSAKDSFITKDYEESGKIQTLKELLKKELLIVSKDKSSVTLISRSKTMWANLYYILKNVGIDYSYLETKNEIIVDFASGTLTATRR